MNETLTQQETKDSQIFEPEISENSNSESSQKSTETLEPEGKSETPDPSDKLILGKFKSTEDLAKAYDNQPETIEIDDEVRQADYKYTYSDSSQTTLKSEQADMLVAAVEKFSQKIDLNLQEIFIWYFEQKGVDNPERFLSGSGENSNPNFADMRQNPLLPLIMQALMKGILEGKKADKDDDSSMQDIINQLAQIHNTEAQNEV